MANVSLVFYDIEDTEITMECFYNTSNDISIIIKSNGIEYIRLDKQTAIKLVKVLKTEISKIKDNG